MKNSPTIGLIGYGHLGHALADKIQEKSSAHLVIANDRSKNKEVAAASDVLILTVRPNQIEEVMQEIREQLKKGVIILSFAAAVPGDFIARGKKLGAPDAQDDKPQVEVVRAMTDIHLLQIIAQDHEKTNNFLGEISGHELLKTAEEKNIDAFTVFVGCLPGVTAWQFAHNAPNAEQWLQGYTQFIHQQLGVSPEVCGEIIDGVRSQGHFEEKIDKVATKGGITEAMLLQLNANPGMSFTALFAAGMQKIEEVKNTITRRPAMSARPVPR